MTPLARRIRRRVLTMAHESQSSHVGSCLSCVDILAELYCGVMRVDPKRPDWPDRDRLIVSPGHKAMALYATLAEVGFFPVERLGEYPHHPFEGHVCRDVPGVEWSTGSLGHGLPVAVGMAMAHPDVRVFCLLSDGDMEEGSTLEAMAVAGANRVGNLYAVLDANGWTATRKIQHSSVFANGWSTIGGPNLNLLHLLGKSASPTIVSVQTTKGAGISFMENDNEFHFRAPNDEEYARAMVELEEAE